MSTVAIAFLLGLSIGTVVALWVNRSWYKFALAQNARWSEFCKEQSAEWSRVARKVAGLEPSDD
jgi:hypothetical protein